MWPTRVLTLSERVSARSTLPTNVLYTVDEGLTLVNPAWMAQGVIQVDKAGVPSSGPHKPELTSQGFF